VYAGEWLAAIPIPFHVAGGPELRAAVAEVTKRLTAALGTAPSNERLPRKDHQPASLPAEPGDHATWLIFGPGPRISCRSERAVLAGQPARFRQGDRSSFQAGLVAFRVGRISQLTPGGWPAG
jgi:hypothetical protein